MSKKLSDIESDKFGINTIQPIDDLFSTDGHLEEFSRIDHQHPLSARLRNAILSLASRNLLDNGAIQVAQKVGGAGFTTSNKFIDRWILGLTTLGTWSVGLTTTAPPNPVGFPSSIGYTNTTANAAPAAGAQMDLEQGIEGRFLQHLYWGSVSARSLVLSFWVKSNVVGTYIAELFRNEGTIRTINISYTINTANTWEYKTVFFPGDVTTPITNDTIGRLFVVLWTGAGSNFTSGTLQTTWANVTNANRAVGQVNLAATVGNNISFTGLQLEIGAKASSFEFKPYDIELEKAMRYFQIYADPPLRGVISAGSVLAYAAMSLPVIMRAVPATTLVGNNMGVFDGAAVTTVTTIALETSTPNMASYNFNTLAALTVGRAGVIYPLGIGSYISISAEL